MPLSADEALARQIAAVLVAAGSPSEDRDNPDVWKAAIKTARKVVTLNAGQNLS